jgi:hypothetical protein
MEWCTRVGATNPGFSIDYRSKLLLVGSCFAENMGRKLDYHGFDVEVNPCGIVYNPLAAANVLELLVKGKRFEERDLLPTHGKWASLYHHGAFSDADPANCLEGLNARLEKGERTLRDADLLVMTWGTAWIYTHVARNVVVTNCHKLPEREFTRRRATVEEIVARYLEIIPAARALNPRLRVLFTVSPIRHWRDGAHGNQLGKATLLLAIEQLQARLADVYYFPAYEIVLDELRDYRFYARDMLHLSPVAIDHVWECFKESFVQPSVLPVMRQVEALRQRAAHRPLHPDETDNEQQQAIAAALDEVIRKARGE